MDTETRVQILHDSDYISRSTITPGRAMDPFICSLDMGKEQDKLSSSALVWQPV